jgi:hypothetical protein
MLAADRPARPRDRGRRALVQVSAIADHGLVVVALHHQGAARGMLGDDVEHRGRVGAVAHEVTEEGVALRPALARMRKAAAQGLEVCVDIREQRDDHRSRCPPVQRQR